MSLATRSIDGPPIRHKLVKDKLGMCFSGMQRQVPLPPLGGAEGALLAEAPMVLAPKKSAFFAYLVMCVALMSAAYCTDSYLQSSPGHAHRAPAPLDLTRLFEYVVPHNCRNNPT